MAQPPRAPPRAVTPASAATIVTGGSAPMPTPGSQPNLPRPPRSGSPSSASSGGRGVAAKLCPTCGERFPVDYRVCPRDVVPLERLSEDEADPLIGVMLADAYRVVRMIGQGGMGRVYEARHARLGARRFAVKVMHEELARKPELVTRFRREAETACVAAHPNVVQVFDVAETEAGLPFIVAELLEGEDLGQRLGTSPKLALATTVPIVRQLCAGLSAAHAQGVVHRDLKPDNVFLVGGDSPTVKLLDFGIARVNDTGAGNRTRTGVIMGTPAYMAPEQAKGAKVDARADIYSVGAILYRCLTGHEPFEAEDPAATLTAVLTKEPKRPRSIAPEIPEAVELVIERAMARDVEHRFQTLAELDAALGALHDDGEASAVVSVPMTGSTGGTPAPADSTRAAQLARPLVAVLSVVGVLLIASGVAGLLGRLLARDEDGLGGSEGMLVVLGTAAVLATPAGMWFRWVRRSVWGNSLRAVGLARRMGTTMAAGAIAYLLVEFVATSVELAVAEAPTLQTGLGVSLVAVALAIAVGWGADRWIARGRGREADAGWRFTNTDAGAREMLVEAEEPLRFEVRAGDSATDIDFYTEHPDLWEYEEEGQIFCNSAFDPEALFDALLQEGLPGVDRGVLLRYLFARPKDPPFSIAGLPCTLFHPVMKHLRRMGVDVFAPREPEARISPVMLTVDDNVLVVARDFHVDVPEFEHRPEWFESEERR